MKVIKTIFAAAIAITFVACGQAPDAADVSIDDDAYAIASELRCGDVDFNQDQIVNALDTHWLLNRWADFTDCYGYSRMELLRSTADFARMRAEFRNIERGPDVGERHVREADRADIRDTREFDGRCEAADLRQDGVIDGEDLRQIRAFEITLSTCR